MATDTMPRTRQAPGRPVPKTPRTAPGGRPESGNPRTTVTAPRHTRPTAGSAARARARSPRMPFILLLVGLLGGALVCLLVISTTLAQGAFRITNLQEQNANLARQEQILTNQVAQAGNPAVIAAEASKLGMRPNPDLTFIDLKTGKIVTGKPSGAGAAINVPGYTP
jgi:hypothetical protein